MSDRLPQRREARRGLDDALYWDPYDSRFAADPWPLFNRMREEAPLYYNEAHDFYAVSRYADVSGC